MDFEKFKVHNIAIKKFCMGRENYCILQKFYTLVLQPRKTPLERRNNIKCFSQLQTPAMHQSGVPKKPRLEA